MKVPIGPRDKFPLMSEINMIPLIDVSLVLLIIFMVVTPFLVSSNIKLNLPKSVSGLSPELEPIKIQITKKKIFYLDDEAVLLENLPSMLRAKLKSRKNSVVLIEADAFTPFDTVVKAMDIAKLEGVEKLGVAVQKEESPKRAP